MREKILGMAACLALISGCGTLSGTRESPRPPVAQTPPAPPATTGAPPPAVAAVTPAPATAPARSGGYYLDDGPGDNPPPNLEAIPDAVPRVEPLHRGALRPYNVMGRAYVPMTEIEPYRARGVASWYGRRYHGKLTSTGEKYDMYGMSAAHPTLPLPSYVRVTSVASGKSVIVRVNDRGPFIDSRLIDLSYTAAYKLGVLKGGSGLVDVELIATGAPAMMAASAPQLAKAAATASPATAPAAAAVPAERQIPIALEGGGTRLQLAAFGNKENAEAYASRLRADVAWLAGQLQVHQRDGLFRVLVGPFGSQGEARQTADKISQDLGTKPFVLVK